MLIFFINCVFAIDIKNRWLLGMKLENLSIVLLTYISILGMVRGQIPEVASLTIVDKCVVAYLITSCFPLLYLIGRSFDEENTYDTQKSINVFM